MTRGVGEKREEVVAVAIDKDKSSQYALKWTVDHLITRGQSITLLHINNKPTSSSSVPNHFGNFGSMNEVYRQQLETQAKDLFLPFRCFCTRKDIKCNEVILEDPDISKSILNYVSAKSIETLVLGAASRNGLIKRFKTTDVPSSVSKAAPEFCTVYVIAKGKISSVRSASSALPTQRSNSCNQIHHHHPPRADRGLHNNPPYNYYDEMEMRSPFTRGASTNRSYELSPDTDISFVSNARPSVDRLFPSLYDNMMEPMASPRSEYEMRLHYESPSHSKEGMDEVEAEMKRLRIELKQTMEMYSAACKEALSAKKKATELHRWKVEEEHRVAEKEKRLEIRYRKYSIEEVEAATEDFSESRKIGEGGYGPVYRGELDHTAVAIKVLRPDAAQGRAQFQQEVEVLSCIRHPNMVLLVGACPEFGCLVYEYMANGSLEDRLLRRGNSPPLPWQLRFRIAAEIATALLFLHQTRPEPLVHRDLKPGNILLDRNFVSKISDVGLARLVPAAVADAVTQYRMTATAGTFCYIDPEYQQTGMLGIKSDVYSLGVLLLQMITAKPPMGLTHHMDRAVQQGSVWEMLDTAVPDWPAQETLCFAKLALDCAQMRRKDRPDLAKVVVPQLNRLRDMAEHPPVHEVITDPQHLSAPSSTASSSTS